MTRVLHFADEGICDESKQETLGCLWLVRVWFCGSMLLSYYLKVLVYNNCLYINTGTLLFHLPLQVTCQTSLLRMQKTEKDALRSYGPSPDTYFGNTDVVIDILFDCSFKWYIFNDSYTFMKSYQCLLSAFRWHSHKCWFLSTKLTPDCRVFDAQIIIFWSNIATRFRGQNNSFQLKLIPPPNHRCLHRVCKWPGVQITNSPPLTMESQCWFRNPADSGISLSHAGESKRPIAERTPSSWETERPIDNILIKMAQEAGVCPCFELNN